MKFKRILYAIAIICMVIIAAVMFKHDLIIAGSFVSLIILASATNYFEVLHRTQNSYTLEARKKKQNARMYAYNTLTKERQEKILDEIERTIAKDTMKLN